MSHDYQEPKEDEYIDANLDTWQLQVADKAGECGHCNEEYSSGENILVCEDHGGKLHAYCWDLHSGFLAAMAKDD